MRVRYCEISCDLNLSPECWEQVGPEPSMAAIVKAAKQDGWYIGPSGAEQDACPECRKMQSHAAL